MAALRFLSLLAVFFLSAWRAESNFRVGVILDMDTLIGKVSRTCIAMAVEDFYSTHEDSKNKIDLFFRDAGGDPVGAASAALELLKEENVHAILGPQRSIQAKFVMEMGTTAQVPVVAFSAKSPALSPALSGYFVRAAMDDSSQAEAIAAVVAYFQWREVVPIFEDSDYGNGMAPSLIEKLQARGAAVPYRSLIPFNSSAAMISSELQRLKLKRTRVFVVHASYDLGSEIFKQAKKEGMMEEGYVWLTTYSLTTASSILGRSEVGDAMEGVIGLKPYFRQTEKMINFKQRWTRRFKQDYPDLALNDPIAFGLWAHDAAWALALAAENLDPVNFTVLSSTPTADFGGVDLSPVGPALLDSITSIDFQGLTGRFQLVNGQLNSSTSEIVNVVNGALKTVGFWTAEKGVMRHLTKGPGLKPIVWPGGQPVVPKGWEWPLTGKRLKIGVPVKPGFGQFVNVTRDPLTNIYEFKGFCIEVFKQVIELLPYDIPFDFVAFDNGQGDNNGTYDDLVYQIYLQKFDGVVGDVTILANRSQYVDFSLPYTDSGVTMVVPVTDDQSNSEWVFTKPFSGGLWLATGCFVILTGLVIWFLEYRDNDDLKGNLVHQAGIIFYFAFSTLVFAHRDKIVSNWSRFVVLVWVFVVLILSSSYTASLTSMMTAQQLQPAVTDLGDLIKRNEVVGYLNDSFLPGMLKQLAVDSKRIVPYSSPDEYAAALDKGTGKGGAGAIVDEIPYLKVFLSKYCGKYTIVGPTYKTNGFGFAFPKGSPILSDLSRAVLNFTEGDKFKTLEKELYGNHNCPTETLKAGSGSLRFINFSGLFLITGTTSIGALIIFIIHFLYKNHANLESIFMSPMSMGGKLYLLLRLYDVDHETAKNMDGREMDVFSQTPGGDGPSIINSEMQSPLTVSVRTMEYDSTPRHGDSPSILNSEMQSPLNMSTHMMQYDSQRQGGEGPSAINSEMQSPPSISSHTMEYDDDQDFFDASPPEGNEAHEGENFHFAAHTSR